MIVTYALMAITCVTSYMAFQNQELMAKMIMHPATVAKESEFFRFISSGFIHADWMHLGLNMYVLHMFADRVEPFYVAKFGQMVGPMVYLLLYFGAMLVSSFPSYIKHKGNFGYRSLGASGAVAGVVFASMLIDPASKMGIIFVPIYLPAAVFGILYLIYSFWASKNSRDNINHDAHAYGAIFGFVFTLAVQPSLLQNFISSLTDLI